MREQIVGRTRELAAGVEFLDALRSRPPSLLLVEGEAGAGKTTIWNETISVALRQGLCVLSCRPSGSETKLSFSALDDLLGGAIDTVLPLLAEPQRRALETVMLRVVGQDSGADGRTVSRAVLEALRLLAASGPLVVAVDDVQWLDGPSAKVLEYVIRRLTIEPIGLLLARRGGRDEAAPLGIDRAPWPDRIRRLPLAPLTVGELHGVVQVHLGLALPHPLLSRMHKAAGGNPFFGLEIARALAREQTPLAPSEPLPIPSTLSELVRARIASLPAAARDVLLVVAALSQPTLELVEAAGNVSASNAIDQALCAGVLALHRERLEFSHPLLAAAVYADATPRRRRMVHRRLADVVNDPEEQARHLGLGSDRPDPEVAARLGAAGELALARGAPSAAAELYEEARRLTPSTEIDDSHRRALQAVKCHAMAGDTRRGVELAEQVVASASSGGVRAEALYLLGHVDLRRSPSPAIALLDRALREVGDRPALKARIRTTLAALHVGQFDLRAAGKHARAAVVAAEAGHDPAALNGALAVAGRVEAMAGGARGINLVTQAISPQEQLHAARTASLPSGWLGTLLRWADDFDGARLRLEPLLTLAIERGDDNSASELQYELGELECWAGNWERAMQLVRDSCILAAQADRPWELSAALGVRASIEAHLGLVDEARTHAAEGLELARSLDAADETVRNLCALGFLELSLSRPRAALDCLAQVAVITAQLGDPGVLRYAGNHIEALIALGELAAADAFLARLELQGRRLDRVWALAIAARCRGQLLAARLDLDGAIAALDGALAMHARLPMPFEHGRTLLTFGATLRRAKHHREARQALSAALSDFERLGATLWTAKAADELARIGGRRAAPTELTATERRIVELVAAGHSNPEVAAELYMSRRTVEDHLSKTYRKIGIRSRTELAHWFVHTQGPAEGSLDRRIPDS